MADKSKIAWTEATWNPVTGCSKVSEGSGSGFKNFESFSEDLRVREFPEEKVRRRFLKGRRPDHESCFLLHWVRLQRRLRL